MVTYETSRPVSTPGRPHRRGGFALLRNLLEVLLTWIVVWSLILIIPSILETAIHQSSVTDVSAQDPILKLEVTSEGQELWIQRGPSELVSMDLATRKTRHIYRNKGRALTHWDVSEDGATYLLSIDEREVMVIRQDELIISEPLSGFSSLHRIA